MLLEYDYQEEELRNAPFIELLSLIQDDHVMGNLLNSWVRTILCYQKIILIE